MQKQQHSTANDTALSNNTSLIQKCQVMLGNQLEIASCVALSRSALCNYPWSLQLFCDVGLLAEFCFWFFSQCARGLMAHWLCWVCCNSPGEPLHSCWIFTYKVSRKGCQKSWEQPPDHCGKISYSPTAGDAQYFHKARHADKNLHFHKVWMQSLPRLE